MSNSNSVHIVELRSDTFSKPSNKMRQAMSIAEVGDAVYEEDPTTNKLQEVIAKMTDKEAAIFMPSNTMANLAAVMSHCIERDREIIVGHLAHMNIWEYGGISQIAPVYTKQIENLDDGTFDLDKLTKYLDDQSYKKSTKTNLICIENTHNYAGGRALPIDFITKLSSICKDNDVKLHMDGARLMNAAVALNVEIETICKHVDSVSISFCKGLGAPVGAVLAGSNDLIKRAKRTRQILGGGMRQTGILAAACLVALEDYREKLSLDHLNAKRFAEGIQSRSHGLLSVKNKVETNIVIAVITNKKLDSKTLIGRLAKVHEEEAEALGIRISIKFICIDKSTIRFVFHLDVSENDIDLALKKLEYVCEEFIKIL